MPHEDPNTQRCIALCNECAETSSHTLIHCLDKGGRHAASDHIRLLVDCAQICDTAVAFMARGSELQPMVCGVCADVCERCAASCERFGDDEMMRKCADLCRRCAESCAAMAGSLLRH
jgi:hypothetical protein